MRSHVSSKFLLLFIPFLLIPLMSQNVSALSTISQINFLKTSRSINGSSFSESTWVSSPSYLPVGFANPGQSSTYLANYIVGSANLPSSATGSYYEMTLTGQLVNTGSSPVFGSNRCDFLEGYVRPEQGTSSSEQSNVYCESSNNDTILNFKIVTLGALSADTTATSFYFYLGNPVDYLYSCSNLSQSMMAPCSPDTAVIAAGLSLDYKLSRDPSLALLETQVLQNETIINQNQEMIDKENAAVDNIDNQSSSDISNAENQATTNLIGVLSNFFTQLQNFQATNCDLDLPFPEFIGGTQTVNICQGKDVLGNFITVIGTLAMVGFYIPLAWVLLKMIYNEIRSFTNG